MLHVEVQGARVPSLGLGTWQLSGDTCRRTVELALEVGYRHIDTAQAYGNEHDVGAAIRASKITRDALWVTTKLWIDALAPEKVARTTRESLSHLEMDYVDLLLIHWPSTQVPVQATLDAMRKLQSEGAVRFIGVSNFTPSLLEEALQIAPVFGNQVEYHPFLAQRELASLARSRGVMLTAYSPLARGRVTKDPTLNAIARAHGKTPTQVTLRWLVQQPNVSAIPKASSESHLRANMDIFDFTLDESEMQRIHALDQGARMIDPDFAPNWDV